MWGTATDAQISREQFSEGLAHVGVTDPLVVEQSFNALDVNGDGSIDFREFLAGMIILSRGSDEDRMRLMFQSYDLDKSGSLSRDEVYAIFRTTYMALGRPLVREQLLADVEAVFRQFDANGDNELNLEEFVAAV